MIYLYGLIASRTTMDHAQKTHGAHTTNFSIHIFPVLDGRSARARTPEVGRIFIHDDRTARANRFDGTYFSNDRDYTRMADSCTYGRGYVITQMATSRFEFLFRIVTISTSF